MLILAIRSNFGNYHWKYLNLFLILIIEAHNSTLMVGMSRQDIHQNHHLVLCYMQKSRQYICT